MVEKKGDPTLQDKVQRLKKEFNDAVEARLRREREMPPLIEVNGPMELQN